MDFIVYYISYYFIYFIIIFNGILVVLGWDIYAVIVPFPEADIFSVKKRLREYRREGMKEDRQEAGLFGSSGKVVLTAIAM